MRDDELLLDEDVLRRGLAGARYDVSGGEPAKVLWRRGRARRARQQVVAVLTGAGAAAVVAAGGLTLLQQTRPPSAEPAGHDSARNVVVIPAVPLGPRNEVEATRRWWIAKAQCHTDNGFPAHYDGEGIETEVGPGQREDYRAMTARCEEEVSAQLGPLPAAIPYSPQELKALYHLNVEVSQCLAEHGYPTAEPPTEETFVSTYQQVYSGSEGALDQLWNPYRADSDVAFDARRVCPAPTESEVTRWLVEHPTQ